MAFLDDFIVSARDAALNLRERAEEVADISKLRFQLSDLEKKRSSAYETIGKLYAESFRTGKNNKDKCTTIIYDIDDLNDRINELSQTIAERVSRSEASKDNVIKP